MKRRNWLLLAGLALVIFVSGCSIGGSKDEYPSKPITWIIASTAGDPGDVTARLLGQYAEKHMPKNVKFVFENKPGAAGTLGATALAESDPDGYTISMNAMAALAIQPALGKTSYAYDDLIPVINYIDASQLVFVRWDAPWETFEDWVEYAKANPGQKYAVSGAMNAQQVGMEHFAQNAGLKLEAVAYKGEPDEINALLRGDIDVAVLNGANSYQYFEAEQIRPLINITGVKQPFDDVRTLREAGYDVQATFFNGVFVPKGTPQERIDYLHDVFTKALQDPELQEEFNKRGLVSNPLNSAQFQELITNLYNDYTEVLKNMGVIE